MAVHHYQSQAAAEETIHEIRARGGTGVAVSGDLTQETAYHSILNQARQALGPIGCLINNASVFEKDEVENVTMTGWDQHMQVNLRAAFVLAQGVAAGLPQECAGIIVNIIDQRVWNPTPFFTSYTVSKCGLWTLTRTMALALAPRLRVNAIGPRPHLAQPFTNPPTISTPMRRASPGPGDNA